MDVKFNSMQKRILLTCIVVYTTAYAGRMNLSAALSSIAGEMSLSMARAGFLQTVFALVYATGQLVNGTVVDHVNPAKYMLVGITGTAVCNLAMGFGQTYTALLIIWALNAVFQSMMWTPIMRMLAMNFPVRRTRERASETVALSLVIGHLASWAVSGFVSGRTGWRYSFIIPACAAFVVAAGAAFALRDVGTIKGESQAQQTKEIQTGDSMLRTLMATGFFFVLVTASMHGFIRDGVITWTPTILHHMSGGQTVSSTTFSLILPMINFVGIMIGFALRRRGARPHSVVAMMMTTTIICALPLLLVSKSLALTVALLGCMCATMYGLNTMLTGLIPFEYHRIGKTGMTAGLVDSFIYAGSALAGALAGGVYEGFGVSALVVLWIAAAAVSIVMMRVSGRMSAAYWKKYD